MTSKPITPPEADGISTLSPAELQARLSELQRRGTNLALDEIREAIQIIRVLRRTNTGPAATKQKKSKAGKDKPSALDLLSDI